MGERGSHSLGCNAMSQVCKSVSAACGHISRAAFARAAKRLGLSEELCQIADAVLVKGYRQSIVARQAGVSRQRVHVVCRQLLDEIN